MVRYYNPLTPKEKLLIALCICIAVALLFGCKSQEKAVQRVLTNEQSFSKVGAKWAALNPCTNDTTIEFINGDTLIYVQRDTLIDVQQNYDTTHTFYHITNTVTKVKRDTVLKVITDNRALNIVKDSLAHYKQMVSKLDGINYQHKQQDKVDGKHKLILALVIALFGIIIGILIRFKI